jgi:hypothetical protein
MADRDTPWLVLTVTKAADGLVLGYADARETRLVDSFVDLSPMFGWGTARQIRVSVPLDLIEEYNEAPWEAPTFFLYIQGRLRLLPVEELLTAFFQAKGLPADGLRWVRLPPRAWRRRRGFRLPLRIAALGEWHHRFNQVVASTWWAQEGLESGALAIGLPHRQESAVDVLIADADDLHEARRLLQPRGLARQARLIVIVDEGSSDLAPLDISSWRLAPGHSVMVLRPPSSSATAQMEQFLEEITHDLTFDRLAAALSRTGPTPLLFSDPFAVQNLRMSDAASAMIDEVGALGRAIFSDTPEKLLATLDDPELGSALREAGTIGKTAFSLIEDARSTSIGFLRESHGFVPLSRTRMLLDQARPAAERTRRILASVDLASKAPEIEQAQDRVVNVTLQRQSYGSGNRPMVEATEMLVRGEPYRLFVEIGERLAGSLVVGAAPPVDPLLPELEHGGHHILHVAVYSSDFDVRSPSASVDLPGTVSRDWRRSPEGRDAVVMQRLELPRIGPSRPVEFLITPLTMGPEAEARIVVYYDASPEEITADPKAYRNHMLQAFRLTAQLEWDEVTGQQRGVRVTLDSSQSERFSNLPSLRPRLLSLALNDGPGAETHRLMMKKAGDAASVQFTEGQMEKALTGIRELLTTLSWNDKRTDARFGTAATAGKELPEDFVLAVRQLAQGGRRLLDLLTSDMAATSMPAMLQPVRDETDKIIQITRLHQSYYFPWTVIYDFARPPRDAPVCGGFRRTHKDGSPYSCRDCLAECLYPDKSKAYCPYGFWGMRHQVEQLVGGTTARDAASRLEPLRDGAVHVAVGLEGGELGELKSRLASALGSRAAWLTLAAADEDLVARLRSPAKRPAVLLVASHCETTPGPFETLRIQLPGEDRWLEPSDILDAVRDDKSPWREPQPLIMLVACGSASADLTSLADFVAAFLNAGAAAVVGTEAIIFEDLAVDFAVEVTPAMLSGRTLGEIILAYRRALLRKGHPLGFLFTAFGPADLAAVVGRQPALLTAA